MRIDKNNFLPQIYFRVMWLLALLLYILIPIESGLLSAVYISIIVITFGVFTLQLFLSANSSVSKISSTQFFHIFVLVLIVVASLVFTKEAITFDTHISAILGFLEMFVAVFLVEYIECNEKIYDFIFKINIAISLVFVVLSRSAYASSGILDDSLYLGYSNPNSTGIYLFLNFSILIIFFNRLTRPISRFFVGAICIYLMYLIYLTKSRICVVAGIVVFIYGFFAAKKKVPFALVPISLIIPLLFLFFYSSMYESGRFLTLEILGKPFYSGREGYYIEMLNALKGYLWVGDVGKNYFPNMHNGPLTILSAVGVLGYALYLSFYWRTLKTYYGNVSTRVQSMSLVVLLAVYLHSSAEAALLVGGAHYSIIVATLYLLLKGEQSSQSESVLQNC